MGVKELGWIVVAVYRGCKGEDGVRWWKHGCCRGGRTRARSACYRLLKVKAWMASDDGCMVLSRRQDEGEIVDHWASIVKGEVVVDIDCGR